ncbi:MAG: hypothetical protein JXA41_10080 [Deltaproteobacteria bacterium]|nr:hypothetical protein [Deltaproteobacteria bacterium]
MQTDLFTFFNPSEPCAEQGGPLQGKSFTIQPNMSVCDWPTEAGSPALKKFVAIEDATVIERLKKAGAYLVGSTCMSELGFGLAGDTTGKVIAGGLSDMALMMDMMGEVRIAAARERVFGFKPTNGIISRFGLIGLVPSMECFGVLAKDPTLIAAAMGVMTGQDERDFSMDETEPPSFDLTDSEKLSIRTMGIIRECVDVLEDTVMSKFKTDLEKLKTWGFSIKELSLPDFDLFRTIHQCIGSVEASSSCGKYDGVRYGHRCHQAKNWNDMYLKSRAESFGTLIKSYLFQGAYFQFQNYDAFENAGRIRARLAGDIHQLFAECDVLTFPTGNGHTADPKTSNQVSDIYDELALTLPANVLGIPAVQIPAFSADGEIDPGLQLMGPRFSDARLLATACRLSRSVEGGR